MQIDLSLRARRANNRKIARKSFWLYQGNVLSKVIVITGAGDGLGRALARRFAADGETVVLLGRTLSKVQAVATEIGAGALAVQCEVSSPDSVRAAFAAIAKQHPTIDVLINNAAVYEPFLIAEATDAQILGIINTNVLGPILCSRSAIPLMTRGSHIINVSSESVEMKFPYLVVYQSSKGGVERFSEGLHHELDPSGIKVTTVRAGQMYEAGKSSGWDPAMAMRFGQAAMAAGLNLRDSPKSQYTAVTAVFRAVIDMPADLQTPLVTVHARNAD
jgi:meso-butanediol dehydrogenase/(S,S)-butanediol dehydrogenase/diacetyl reductase